MVAVAHTCLQEGAVHITIATSMVVVAAVVDCTLVVALVLLAAAVPFRTRWAAAWMVDQNRCLLAYHIEVCCTVARRDWYSSEQRVVVQAWGFSLFPLLALAIIRIKYCERFP